MDLPMLGVGFTYNSGLDPLLESHPNLIDVLEIEPQTLWFHTNSETIPYRIDAESLERIGSLSCPKILHGIGFPVGGSKPPDPRQIPPLLKMVNDLGAPWVSEHLSFNQANGPTGDFKTGFLLPPRQTTLGIRAAVESIRSMAEVLPVPLAVETGVNYLRPRRDELPDGEWISAVVETANCGLLLDLHNLWTNELNGRQTVREFLDQIPLHRVWEVHLAGGFEQDGYWLDSHSGAVPKELMQLASSVVPELPNVRALIFELFPAYLDSVGIDTVRAQLEGLHRIWDMRGSSRYRNRPRRSSKPKLTNQPSTCDSPTPGDWEDVLGALVIGREVDGPLATELLGDPGVNVIRNLLGEFRASMVVATLRLTSRLLMLTMGNEGLNSLLKEHWMLHPPQIFASSESNAFANYLQSRKLEIPYLSEVLAYERGVLAAIIDRKRVLVPFEHDPLALLRSLAEGRLPESLATGNFEIEVTPDSTILAGDLNGYHRIAGHH